MLCRHTHTQMGVALSRASTFVETPPDNVGRYLWSSRRPSKVEGLSGRNLTYLSDVKCVGGSGWYGT